MAVNGENYRTIFWRGKRFTVSSGLLHKDRIGCLFAVKVHRANLHDIKLSIAAHRKVEISKKFFLAGFKLLPKNLK